MTNATKAALDAFANAVLGLLILVGVFSPEVGGAILVIINTGFALALTLFPSVNPLHYTNSRKRFPEPV